MSSHCRVLSAATALRVAIEHPPLGREIVVGALVVILTQCATPR
jgi:hypothetical protein